MHWRWAVLAGLVVGVLGILLPYQSVSTYSLVLRVGGREASPERLEDAAYVLLVWVTPVVFLLMAAFAASWAARRGGGAPLAHGVATGVVAAAVLQVVASVAFPPARPAEAAQYLILGAVGGYLGGAEARSSLRLQEALYSASLAIGEAQDAEAVVRAFGERLCHAAGFDVVGLWHEAGETEGLALWARWERADGNAGRTLPSAALVREAVEAGEFAGPEGDAWAELGICSAVIMPLKAPDGGMVGVLVAGSGERGAIGRGSARACRTAATQAALALENIRLVEEAKKAGERGGVLIERQRLAREIHDALAQSFASISFRLAAARSGRPAGYTLEEEVRRHLDHAAVTAREGLSICW